MNDDDKMMEIRMVLYRNGNVGVAVATDPSIPAGLYGVLQHGLVSACIDIRVPGKIQEPKP